MELSHSRGANLGSAAVIAAETDALKSFPDALSVHAVVVVQILTTDRKVQYCATGSDGYSASALVGVAAAYVQRVGGQVTA